MKRQVLLLLRHEMFAAIGVFSSGMPVPPIGACRLPWVAMVSFDFRGHPPGGHESGGCVEGESGEDGFFLGAGSFPWGEGQGLGTTCRHRDRFSVS